MFKKLKEKITEEVKSSPQRLQQFTQSVSDRLQNSAPSDENFFSIGDDDASTSASEPGFSTVPLTSTPQDGGGRHRRNSNSSMASDVSFLPQYESTASMYHLQSDLDVSASEMEDNVSTSSQLGHLSKEQIYSAFQKAQMRYHKYRGRYTDLGRHYKDLEREIAKMKSVLVDTQDKAIRRVTELKEQCALEQKAKAHLEGALRDELDEKQFKIETLQTKIELLQGAGDTQPNGTDSKQNEENLEQLTKYLNEARLEIESLNLKLQEMKANAIVFQTKEQEYKTKISNLDKQIAQFGERERENNLVLAQSKMELHNELLSKDAEISNLKQDNEVLRHSLEAFETKAGATKMENLQSQNKKLIDKLENLTQKCNNYEKEMLKMEQYKQQSADLRAKLKEAEANLEAVREEAKKSLLSLETRIKSQLDKEFADKEHELGEDFKRKLEELSSNSSNLQEAQLSLVEKQQLIKQLQAKVAEMEQSLDDRQQRYAALERNHLDLIEDGVQLRSKISTLEKDLSARESDESGAATKIERMEATIASLKKEIDDNRPPKQEYLRLQADYKALVAEKTEVEVTNQHLEERLRLLEEKGEAEEMDSTENKLLEMKVQKLEQERLEMMTNFEKQRLIFEEMLKHRIDYNSAKVNISNLEDIILVSNQHLDHLKLMLKEQESELKATGEDNVTLDHLVTELQEKCRILEEKQQAIELDTTETKLLEMKLQHLEEEREALMAGFDEERKIFNQLIADNSKLKESEHKAALLEAETKQLQEQLEEVSTSLAQLQADYRVLAEDKTATDSVRRHLEERVRIFEEKDEAIDLENTESKLLEMKLQKLEEERKSMIDNFEKQQHIFEALLADNSKLKESQAKTTALEEALSQTREQLEEVSTTLAQLQGDFRELADNKTKVDAIRVHLEEQVRIFEEKDEAVEIEKTECKLLEMKVQQLDGELKNVVDNYDQERQLYEHESYKKITHLEEVVSSLKEELARLRKVADEKVKLDVFVADIQNKHDLQSQKWDEERMLLLETMHDERQALTQADYPNRVNNLETANGELTAAVANYLKEIDRLKQCEVEEAVLRQRLSVLEDDLRTKTHQVDRLVHQIDHYTVQIESRLNNLGQQLQDKGVSLKIVNDKPPQDNLDDLQSKFYTFDQFWSSENDAFDKLIKLVEQMDCDIHNHRDLVKEAQRNLQISESKCQILAQENQQLIIEQDSWRHKVDDMQEAKNSLENNLSHFKDADGKLARLTIDNAALTDDNAKLKDHSAELERRNGQITADNKYLTDENHGLVAEIEDLRLKIEQAVAEGDQTKANDSLKSQVAELERHLSELMHEKQLLQDEILELKTAPVNLNGRLDNLDIIKQEQVLNEKHQREVESLRDKLTQYKSLDITNKSSIEFYESELQKMKNQNEKLNRKLDETLVTLNHCAELSNSTEIEYLKNVLYNYMLGKESIVLARVIAAVCKFDKQQTETVLAREQHKQTLLGQLGIL